MNDECAAVGDVSAAVGVEFDAVEEEPSGIGISCYYNAPGDDDFLSTSELSVHVTNIPGVGTDGATGSGESIEGLGDWAELLDDNLLVASGDEFLEINSPKSRPLDTDALVSVAQLWME
ncbi:MAG: hypothetical protein GY925_29450 [Actinomycetia bacterium]|nr:hypothetical protein [Actinomycetes bacterium]